MIRFCGYDWIPQERWGQMHPDKPYVWYDADMIEQHNPTYLTLKADYKPKMFRNRKAEMAVGLISCTEEFSYGSFSLDAKLPTQAYAWPAFWMWSWYSWPPEIDVFEGYANRKGNYNNKWWQVLIGQPYKVETNIHLKKGTNLGALCGRVVSPHKKFNNYRLEWTPKYIHIFYNDFLVRKVDGDALDYFKDQRMNVVINNSLYKPHVSHSETTGCFEVKNFVYEKY